MTNKEYIQWNPLIVSMAVNYCKWNRLAKWEIQDLIQEGFLGMCLNEHKWDETKGAKLSFLTNYAKVAMSKYVGNPRKNNKGETKYKSPQNNFNKGIISDNDVGGE